MVLSMVKEQLNHNKIMMVSDVEDKKPFEWVVKGKKLFNHKDGSLCTIFDKGN
jgi:hypothetical protein